MRLSLTSPSFFPPSFIFFFFYPSNDLLWEMFWKDTATPWRYLRTRLFTFLMGKDGGGPRVGLEADSDKHVMDARDKERLHHRHRLLLTVCLQLLSVLLMVMMSGLTCGYELSHGWLRHSPAEALFSGTISSMGRRKCVKWPASSCAQPYFSTSTSNSDHGFSLVMCRSSPAGGGKGQSQ